MVIKIAVGIALDKRFLVVLDAGNCKILEQGSPFLNITATQQFQLVFSKPVPNTISPDIEVPSVTDNNIEKQDLETRAAPFLAGTKTRAINKKEYDELIEDFEKVLDQIPEDDPLRNIYDKLCLLF